MTISNHFGNMFPHFIGFDRLFDELDRVNVNQKPSYPPHNIVKTGEDTYVIQLAVAGFSEDNLDIELKEHVLTISGEIKGDDPEGYEFLHKGISARKFKRTFTLNEMVEVTGSDLTNGVLTIGLERIVPEEKKARKIEIGSLEMKQPELLFEG